MTIEQYVDAVLSGELFDPVLSIHIKDGWTVVKPIHGYLQHDEDTRMGRGHPVGESRLPTAPRI